MITHMDIELETWFDDDGSVGVSRDVPVELLVVVVPLQRVQTLCAQVERARHVHTRPCV